MSGRLGPQDLMAWRGRASLARLWRRNRFAVRWQATQRNCPPIARFCKKCLLQE